MARKTIFNDLMGQGIEPLRPDDAPRQKSRAIGAVSKSIADLKTRAILEIDPSEIEAGGVRDRLGQNADEHRALVDSLRAHGQQVPVLVRPHPTDPERYQIVYGRRRLLALRELGLPVKAMVRDLDDQALVIAQGQENTARLDLSFIEKVNFARQMRDAGYKGSAISDALSVDKTVVSRMLKVADRIPVSLIEAIGPAPGIGRPRWLTFADALEAQKPDLQDILTRVQEATGRTSEDRFDLALQVLSAPKPRPVRDPVAEDVQIKRSSGQIRLVLPDDAFGEWLIQAIPELRKKHAQET